MTQGRGCRAQRLWAARGCGACSTYSKRSSCDQREDGRGDEHVADVLGQNGGHDGPQRRQRAEQVESIVPACPPPPPTSTHAHARTAPTSETHAGAQHRGLRGATAAARSGLHNTCATMRHAPTSLLYLVRRRTASSTWTAKNAPMPVPATYAIPARRVSRAQLGRTSLIVREVCEAAVSGSTPTECAVSPTHSLAAGTRRSKASNRL